jgi:hypothetical protein
MGIAAYNRGTVCLSRQIDDMRPDHNSEVVRSINELPRGATRLFCATVVRMLPPGDAFKWALMNRREHGFASSCHAYKTLREMFAVWNCYVVGYGKDDHSFYYEVETLA